MKFDIFLQINHVDLEDLYYKTININIIYNHTNTLAQRHSPTRFTHTITGICIESMI